MIQPGEIAERALRALEASEAMLPDAIRGALIHVAERLRLRPALPNEVRALEADDGDREEMLAVAKLMQSMRGPP